MPFSPLSAPYTVEKLINRAMDHAVHSPSLILSSGFLWASYREDNKQSDDPCRLLPFSDSLEWIPMSFMPFTPLLWFSRVDSYQLRIEKIINRAMIHAVHSPSLILSSGFLSAPYREVNKQSYGPCRSLPFSDFLEQTPIRSIYCRKVNKQSDGPCRSFSFSDSLEWIPISFI